MVKILLWKKWNWI